MRKYEFEQFKKRLKNTYYNNFRKIEPTRKPSNRPRKLEDMEILLKVIIWRKKKWLETGRLVELGPRKYKLIVDGR